MSEPIRLFDKDGNEVIRYSPAVAHMEVSAGLLFTQPPVMDADEGMPALDGMPQDDEPVPMSKRVGRPRKAQGIL